MTSATTTETSQSEHSDTHAASHSHERPSYDDINVPVVLLIGVISAIGTFLTIWFVEGIYYHWKNGLVREISYDVTNLRQVELLDGQKAVLEGDEEMGIASLESVISDVVARYNTSASENNQPVNASDAHGDEHE